MTGKTICFASGNKLFWRARQVDLFPVSLVASRFFFLGELHFAERVGYHRKYNEGENGQAADSEKYDNTSKVPGKNEKPVRKAARGMLFLD